MVRRLTAIKAFMHFVEHRVPSALEQIKRILAVPAQKTDLRVVDHLSADEARRLLDAPDPTTRSGIRDRTMLLLALAGGLRVSELVGLRLDDVTFDARYVSLHVRGKGRKDRILTPSGRPSLNPFAPGSPPGATHPSRSCFSMPGGRR